MAYEVIFYKLKKSAKGRTTRGQFDTVSAPHIGALLSVVVDKLLVLDDAESVSLDVRKTESQLDSDKINQMEMF